MRTFGRLHERVLISCIAVAALANAAYYGGALRIGGGVTPPSAGAPSGGAGAPARADVAAETDASTALPGRFVPSQGRQHTDSYPLGQVPFCPADAVRDDCYASNPPSSGLHLPVQALVVLPDGNRLRIPPEPGVYPFAIPREAIPHIEEHAGVFIGYNCAGAACARAVDGVTSVVKQELSLGARVVLAPDPDLPRDSIGLASWTRVDSFAAPAYTEARVRRFIKAHSCRFDPERFCRAPVIN